MNKKSRFKSFLLSMFPGVGHMYLGFTSRGFIFLGAVLAIIFALQFMGPVNFSRGLFNFQILRGYRQILEFTIPLVWLFSVIDNFILTTQLNKGAFLVSTGDSFQGTDLDKALQNQNKKLLSLLLNIIPGAGHIFIGYKDKGIQIAGSFFFIYIIGQLTGLDLLNFISVLVWIYSILDVINIGNNDSSMGRNELSSKDFNTAISHFKDRLNWVGYFLIFIGIMTLINRFASEFIDKNLFRQIESYVKDGLISIVSIGLGLKLLMGKKKKFTEIGGDKE